MREISEQGKQAVVTPLQLRNLNHRLDKLASQVSAIDSDSRRTRDGKRGCKLFCVFSFLKQNNWII
jgi:hypothetical protein